MSRLVPSLSLVPTYPRNFRRLFREGWRGRSIHSCRLYAHSTFLLSSDYELFSLYLSSGSPATLLESSVHTLFPCATEGVGGTAKLSENNEPAGFALPSRPVSFHRYVVTPYFLLLSAGNTSPACPTTSGLVRRARVRPQTSKIEAPASGSDELNHVESHSCIKHRGGGQTPANSLAKLSQNSDCSRPGHFMP